MPANYREPAGITKARIRKLNAEAALAELALEKAEGLVITAADSNARLERILMAFRGRVLSAAGKYAPANVGLRSVIEAQTRLEAIMQELLETLHADYQALQVEVEEPDARDEEKGDSSAPRRGRGRPRGARTLPEALRK